MVEEKKHDSRFKSLAGKRIHLQNKKDSGGTVRIVRENPLDLYMNEINRYDRITIQEEKLLARRIHGERPALSQTARETLITANLRLVVKIAHDYSGFGVPLQDLISEGNIGLMRAVEKFAPEKGAKFSSYAAWWIKQSIRRALSNQKDTIRIPIQSMSKLNRIRECIRAFRQEYGCEPSDFEISKRSGFTLRTVAMLRRAEHRTISLQDQIQTDGSGDEIGELIADPRAVSPEHRASAQDSLTRLHTAMKSLEKREQIVLVRRFGLDGMPPETLELVSQRIGRTRERVRQIQSQALEKLRDMLPDEAFDVVP